MEWDSDQEREAEAIVEQQRANPMPEDQQGKRGRRRVWAHREKGNPAHRRFT